MTFRELLCSSTLVGGLGQMSIYFSATNIILSITAILGNFLILIALNKKNSLYPSSKHLYRCLATTDLLVGLVTEPINAIYWMALAYQHWSICRYARDAAYVTGYSLCEASLLTMTAISLDRLLALLLGLRYRHFVTLKRMYIITAIVCVISVAVASFSITHTHITRWYIMIVTLSCSVISIASYTKIFRSLSHHQAQQQPSQPNALNMARYREALYSALWVQLALVVCYAPQFMVLLVITHSKTYSSFTFVISGIASVVVYLNSTLNPFLYCWKIRRVRQAVKQTIRQAFCCPWT